MDVAARFPVRRTDVEGVEGMRWVGGEGRGKVKPS